jgi:hypothetical protein
LKTNKSGQLTIRIDELIARFAHHAEHLGVVGGIERIGPDIIAVVGVRHG